MISRAGHTKMERKNGIAVRLADSFAPHNEWKIRGEQKQKKNSILIPVDGGWGADKKIE